MRKIIISLLCSSFLSGPVYSQNITYNIYEEVIGEIIISSYGNDNLIRNQLTVLLNKNPSQRNYILSLIDRYYPQYFSQSNNSDSVNASRGVKSTQSGANLGVIGLGAGVLAALALSGGGNKKQNSPPNNPEDPVIPSPPIEDNIFVTQEFMRNYGLMSIGVQDVYLNEGLSGKGVLVSVIDSGLEQDHPDLIGNVDTVNSYSFATNSGDTIDYEGHGTHVAGIIAGMKNDFGTHGVAFNSKIMGVQTIVQTADDGWWYDRHIDPITNKDLADSFTISMRAGASVINNSWGYDNTYLGDFASRIDVESFLESDMVSALNQLSNTDIVSVFSAGNDAYTEVGIMGGLPYYMPELRDNIVVVGSVNGDKEISSFSNRCGLAADWCLVAPGENIYSTLSSYYYGENAYGTMTGTSMAAPFVSGSIALMREKFPELTSAEVLNILYDQADDLGEVGTDSIYGRGMLNLGNSLSPQGDLSFNMTNDINGQKHSMYQTGFISNGVVSLMFGLSEKSVMITDKYNRGFFVSADKFENTHLGQQNTGAERSVLTNSRINVDMRSFIEDDFSMYQGVVADSEYISPFNNSYFYKPYESLMSDGSNGFRVNRDLSDSFSVQGDIILDRGGNSIFKLRNRMESAGVGFSFETGNMSEKGYILGSFGYGALDTSKIDTQTKYIGISSDFSLNQDTKVMLSASLGDTRFTGDSLLSYNGDIKTKSYSLTIKKDSFMSSRGSLSLLIAKPLHIDSGSVLVNLPVSRGVSVNGVPNTEILRENAEIDLKSDSAIQFGLNYNLGLTDTSYLSISSNYIKNDIQSSFGISWRF